MPIKDWPAYVRGYLPPWFDLEPYESARDWKAERWNREIRDRALIKMRIPDELGILDDYRTDEASPRLQRAFLRLTEQTTPPLSDPDDWVRLPGDIAVANSLGWACLDSPLRSMRIKDAQSIVRRYPGLSAPNLSVSDPSKRLTNSTIQFLMVDLSVTDAFLVDAFAEWLRETREELGCLEPVKVTQRIRIPGEARRRGQRSGLKKSDLDRWVALRVLPCLDIRLWLASQSEPEPGPGEWLDILFHRYQGDDQPDRFTEIDKVSRWLLSKAARGLLADAHHAGL